MTFLFWLVLALAPADAVAQECACNDDCDGDAGACPYCSAAGTCASDCEAGPGGGGIPCGGDGGVEPLHRVYRTGGCGCDAAGGGLGGAALLFAAWARRRYPSSPSQS